MLLEQVDEVLGAVAEHAVANHGDGAPVLVDAGSGDAEQGRADGYVERVGIVEGGGDCGEGSDGATDLQVVGGCDGVEQRPIARPLPGR